MMSSEVDMRCPAIGPEMSDNPLERLGLGIESSAIPLAALKESRPNAEIDVETFDGPALIRVGN